MKRKRVKPAETALPRAGYVTLGHWDEWKQRCTVHRCDAEAKAAFQQLGTAMFKKYFVAAMAAQDRHDVPHPEMDDLLTVDHPGRCWDLFEIHLVADKTQTGKAYKDWLFDRVKAAPEAAGGILYQNAHVLMRSVVREYVRSERMIGKFKWLDGPAFSNDDGEERSVMDSFEDKSLLSVSPAMALALKEYSAIADEEATLFFEAMSRRLRVVWLADSIGLSLDDPAVNKLADAKKSVLYEDFKKIASVVKAGLNKKYESEQTEGLQLLASLTLKKIAEKCIEWGREPENGCDELFLRLEEISPESIV